ncbi:folate-binding protein [Dokdonella sp.]|uniref:CAF17-like 4Fe-4S cluster assembly/insertion protein YgfZ n=1 Tax=Dokdonella sp. TaxID=2291710 RepID=UPI0025C0129D|nr:folate-binding protein [Dokdonella sp.]MBX3688114.1 folate-binding protein YgfZ [Dokdonella sp.]
MQTALGSAALLRLKGADALAFAHSQFSRDVLALQPGQYGWSAWLDAQGRARSVFALLRTAADTLMLWWPEGDAGLLATELRRFVLRSRLVIEALEGWQLLPCALADLPIGSELAEHLGGWALRLPDSDTPRGVVLAPMDLALDPDAQQNRLRADLMARLPWIAPPTAGLFTPQALELERLGAIAFDKGCYPGQEIVARLHFRGGNKRGLRVLETGAEACAAGTALIDDTGAIRGSVLYGCAPTAKALALALAVVSLDAMDRRLRPSSGSPSF